MKNELVTVYNVDETTFEKSTELVEKVVLVKWFELVETSRLDNWNVMVEVSDIKEDDEVKEMIELKVKDIVDKVELDDQSDLEVVSRIAFVEKDVSKLDECCDLWNIIELERVDVI